MIEPQQTVAQRASTAYARIAFTRADLIEHGMTARSIAGAVRRGELHRVRRDRYLLPSADVDIVEAVRIGGRLSCVSLLAIIGVFVHRRDGLHIMATPGSSRFREANGSRVTFHWNAASGELDLLHVAPMVDAARHAVRCQWPRAAVATLDSLVHHGLLSMDELVHVFAGLAARFQVLLPLVDGSAASGPETFVRLILRTLGVAFQTQVYIDGVGTVDFVVDGWLIIECDSKEFHEGWAKQRDDRRRDLAAAARGYVTVRPMASDILGDPAPVRQVIQDVIDALGPKFTAGGRSRLSKNVARKRGVLPQH